MSLEQIGVLLDAEARGRHDLLEAHLRAGRAGQSIERSRAMTEHALRCRAHDIAACPRFAAFVDDLVDAAHRPRWSTRPIAHPPTGRGRNQAARHQPADGLSIASQGSPASVSGTRSAVLIRRELVALEGNSAAYGRSRMPLSRLTRHRAPSPAQSVCRWAWSVSRTTVHPSAPVPRGGACQGSAPCGSSGSVRRRCRAPGVDHLAVLSRKIAPGSPLTRWRSTTPPIRLNGWTSEASTSPPSRHRRCLAPLRRLAAAVTEHVDIRGEQFAQSATSPSRKASKNRSASPPLMLVGHEPGPARVHVPACPQRKLAAGCLRAAHGRCDLGVVEAEHLAQHEDRALQGLSRSSSSSAAIDTESASSAARSGSW